MSEQYVVCAACTAKILLINAVDIGINPRTGLTLYICEECDEEEGGE